MEDKEKIRRHRYSREHQFVYGITPTEFGKRIFEIPGGGSEEDERFGSPHAMMCPTCAGSSLVPGECPRCYRSGIDPFYIFNKCRRCHGTGTIK